MDPLKKIDKEKLYFLERVVNYANDCVLVTEAEPFDGPDGPKIVYVNEAFTRITGYSRDEVIGKTPRILKGPLSNRAVHDTIRAALEAWEPVQVEVLNYKKNGETFWSELSIVPIADETGWFTHWVSVQRDITERKETELQLKEISASLQEALNKSQEAVLAKSRFLATMSHEIRTPMNGVIGMASLLLETPLNTEQRDYIRMINDSGEHLLTIINDILDFSKFESGHLELEQQSFDLSTHVRSVIASFKPQTNRKQLKLGYYCAPDVDHLVVGDSGRLRQILVNLIGNAIKFTETGTIKVVVKRSDVKDSPGDTSNQMLQISVIDTGIGIPADKLGRLFLSFSQADASTSRKFGGTGLGLAICKRLAEAMGGRIWVESTAGIGSSFSFTANLPPDKSDKKAEKQDRPKPKALKLNHDWHGAKALIIESNQTSQKVLGHILKQFGFLVAANDFDSEVYAQYQKTKADIVFIGIFSASSNSFEIIEKLSSEESSEKKPTLVGLVNETTEDVRTLCQSHGIQEILGFPFQKDQPYSFTQQSSTVHTYRRNDRA